MNSMLQHINDLLFLHECVVLPGLGGIISNYSASYFDEKSSIFYPPKKELSFNKNLSKNDGLLISYVSEKEAVSYEKAAKYVAYYIEDLKVKLNQGQRVVFENVGVLYCDRKFNILFEPFDFNFLADSWGMDELSLDDDTYSEVSRVSQGVGYKVKIGIAAAAFGGTMFVAGATKDSINFNHMQASLGLTDVFSEESRVDKPEISPDDELLNCNPFNQE